MSIHIILKLMIKFILPIVVFIAAVYGISYFWTNSSSKGKKRIALGLIIALIIGISFTIYLISD
jgi:hypothetical protein